MIAEFTEAPRSSPMKWNDELNNVPPEERLRSAREANIASAAASAKPGAAVYGVEPAAGNDGEQSFRSGRIVSIDPPNTIADGARTLAIGQRNFAVIRERVKDVVSVDDDTLLDTVKFAMYRTKLVIEPTGALGLAALFAGKIRAKGPVAVVISGGNLDFSLLCR